MKITNSLLVKVGLLSGALLTAMALTAIASDWTAPISAPPGNNVPAPINIGSTWQYKTGKLSIGTNSLVTPGDESSQPSLDVVGTGSFTNIAVASALSLGISGAPGTLKIFTGTPAAGQVLTAQDSQGTAAWATVSSGSSGECGYDGYMYKIPDKSMDDWGTLHSNSELEFYCRNHVVRWCLTNTFYNDGGYACPWRTNIAGDDSHTCSASNVTSGLNTNPNDGVSPISQSTSPSALWSGNNFNPNATLMADAVRYKWNNYTWYLCANGLKQGYP